MPVVKCPHCGFIWTPRLRSPRWCSRCKRFIKGRLIQVTDRADWQGRIPIWKEEGKLVTTPTYCSICGEWKTRLVEIRNTRYCGECIYRLLKEDSVQWKV